MLKRAATGFAMAITAMFAKGVADNPHVPYRGPTRPRRVKGRAVVRKDDKLARRLERNGAAAGTLTARHGTPYNDRETMMRLRAMANGASVEIYRDDNGRVIDRHVVWPKRAML